MLVLVSFYVDCGRSGDLHGLFVCEKEELDGAYGKVAHFGEVLGKHSDVVVTLDEGDFEIMSDDKELIAKLVKVAGSYDVCGYNPLHWAEDEDEDDDDGED